MKSLYFIRHAKSSWDDSSLADIDRPLNKRGMRDAPFMAQLLKGKGVQPDLIISSPANRAFITASHFAKALDIAVDDIQVEERIYEAWPDDVMEIVRALPKKHRTVLVFGHNPTFTSIANLFAEDYIVNVPTCGIVHLESSASEWKLLSDANTQLEAFHFPKQYFS